VLLIIPCVTVCACEKEKPTRSLHALQEEERRQKFEDDLRLIRRYDQGLASTLQYAKARPDLFPRTEDVQLTAKQKRELRTIWQTILDYMRALDGIKGYWKDFHKFGMIRERRAHAEAFMAGYSAWLVQYRHGLDFIEMTVPSKPMEKLLDERSRRFDIPGGAFASLKWNVIHVKAITRLLGSRQYWKTLMPAMRDYDCHKKKWCNWGLKATDAYHDSSKEQLKERAAIEFSYNAFDIARDMSFDAWFPVQKGVSAWMGDTKVRRLHRHLVTEEQLETMRTHMEPGDIIVARQNWYLSNVGLPGFWPHAELYLGSPEELAEYFDDEGVKQYFKELSGVSSFPAHLQKTYPKVWNAYVSAEPDPHRVIEAISEGVVFSTLEKAAGADYVGVMRPSRSKLEKARAIVRAFELWGRPYDFNFDFTTDDTLVCTELVFKSWRKRPNVRGIGLSTAKVMGRVTLPANDVVRQFDEHADDPNPPLDFVYFLDGREKKKTAVVGTREAFRTSWKRPKWDPLQK
jgi:hypothetical protein